MVRRAASFLALLCACSTPPSTTIPPAALAIATTTLPEAPVDAPYEATLRAAGGHAPYKWSVDGLPEGLAVVRETGKISGTPTTPGRFPLILILIDGKATSARGEVELVVRGRPLAIATATLPDAKEATTYAATLEAPGGTPPLSWSIASGLPAGLTASPRGAISGRPEAPGMFTVEAVVTDAESQMARKSLALVVRPLMPMILAETLPNARFGEDYEHRLQVSETRPPVEWSLVSGRLPAGIGLDNTGVIAGRATEDGTFSFVVQAQDGARRSDQASFELLVIAPLAFRTRGLPIAVVGRPYRATFEATGGVPPLEYSVFGALPAGLTFAANGVISGATRAVGSYPLQVTVRDSAGSTPRLGAYTLNVSDDYEYDIATPTPFPVTCTSTAVSITELPIEIVDSFAITSLRSVAVAYSFNDSAPQFGVPNGRLRLWLVSPRGAVIHLCGVQFDQCPMLAAGSAGTWPPLMSQTPLSVVNGTNPRGTWRLRAGVSEPSRTTAGACQQSGSIDRVQLVFSDDASDQPYTFVKGWFANNLIQIPWVRLSSPHNVGESEIALSVERWSPGPNGVREATLGDDVLAPDVFTWTAVSAPAGTDISPDGYLVGGQVTGRGVLRAEDSQGQGTDFDFMVVPPDWNRRLSN